MIFIFINFYINEIFYIIKQQKIYVNAFDHGVTGFRDKIFSTPRGRRGARNKGKTV